MFNLFVTYAAKNSEERKAFYDEVKAAGIIDATRQEDGNIRYEYYFSADRDNEILLIENWKDKASQEYHDQLPHIKTLGEIKARHGIDTEFTEF